ncbi:MAG: hypothetical protein ACMUIA_03460 [bacterium]
MKNVLYSKKLIVLSVVVLLIFGTLGILRAVNMEYNRPNPLMDYVPQEIGIYDTMYWELNESDCRSCHGNSLADRHHNTATVIVDGDCIACHEVTATGVSMVRDCTTSGCHSWQDLDNGWHHDTDMSDSSNCVACHGSNLIEEITPIRDFSMYPPSIVTPTPFSCENCHWEQSAWSTGDPQNPGHPSTYDHSDAWGQFTGFHEYSKPIYGNADTHHMEFMGNVASECYQCHSQNPGNPSWDPYNPQLIRYCEICHSIGTLHRIRPHVQGTNGWASVGFHVPFENIDPTDEDPVRYRTWRQTGLYLPELFPGFTANQQCFGCHGDDIPTGPMPPVPVSPPIIEVSAAGIQPSHGCCGALVTLRGQCFGDEHAEGYSVQFRYDVDTWMDMPIYSWTETLIEFEVPCWTLLPAGNYDVRVVTPAGTSNIRVFTIEDCSYSLDLTPEDGPCGTWIQISATGSAGFGNYQTEIFADSNHGVCRLVDFAASQGVYTALDYGNWSSTGFEVKFYNVFKDARDPETGKRNFVWDVGSEPAFYRCDSLALGNWQVYIKTIYFVDTDGSGDLSSSDTIYQVATSDPLTFELRNDPILYRTSPTMIKPDDVLRIFGLNLGPAKGNGEVRIGSEAEAVSPILGQGNPLTGVVSWSNTVVKMRAEILPEWRGKIHYVWIEKNGLKSNFQRLRIL